MRKSISLACILKNEVNNLPRLLASVEGCFDEIHLTDTGSTDGSIELIEGWIKAGDNPSKSPLHLHHFEWCDDFSRARNASFAPVTTDYVMWMDLDDVLSSNKDFITWRDSVMHLAEFWLNTYHYHFSKEGKPLCSFARERVIKTGLGLKWTYFVHEGILPDKKGLQVSYAQTWSVNHQRGEADLLADRSRNLKLFEKNPKRDARMSYYYGKELWEHGKAIDAFPELVKAAADPDLQNHDRIMALQYACLCAMHLNQFDRAIQLAHQGLQLEPNRAEFFIVISDSLLKLGKVKEAIAYYTAAANCEYRGTSGVQGAIFAHEDSYRHYPLTQLAKIFANMEQFSVAREYALKAMSFGKAAEMETMLKELDKVEAKLKLPAENRFKSRDIIITCPPGSLYEWDWQVYQERGIGGSETAAVEMAKWLSELTNRSVKVFGSRKTKTTFGLVEYLPVEGILDYLKENEPALHIAWRHCTKFSNDPFYVWSHDLAFAGIEKMPENAKVLALSQFHRSFLMGLYGVKAENIIVTSNGIDPNRFYDSVTKEPGKIVFSSSPDRGLDRALRVMDEVIKLHPEARLHVYYGFDNMVKMGLHDKVKELQDMMAARPYVVFHGNLQQKELTKEIASACVWLYPTNFLETYCITAIEMLCSKVFPVVRNWGALPNTLADAAMRGMAKIVTSDCETEKEVAEYAKEVVEALKTDAWKRVSVNPEDYSWQKVAESWINLFGLEERCLKLSNS